jgi:RHS repeat-associated protein
LLEGAGNDYDQASLLVSLLRASGISAGYASQWSAIYYDSTSSNMATAVNWLGLSETPLEGIPLSTAAEAQRVAWGWTEAQYKQTLFLSDYCETRGYTAKYYTNYPGIVFVERRVAVAQIDSNYYRLDPSAKPRNFSTPMDILTATGYDRASFLSAIGGTEQNNYVTGILQAAIKSQFETLTANLQQEISSSKPTSSVDNLLGLGSPIQYSFSTLSGNFSFLPVITSPADGLVITYAQTVPTEDMSSLEIQVDSGTAYSIPMPKLAGQRLSISHDGNTIRFWLEDDQIFTRSSSSATYELTMRAIHPHTREATQEDVTNGLASTVGEEIKTHDGETTNTYKKNNDYAYALIYAFAPSQRFLRSRTQALSEILEEIRALDPDLISDAGEIDFENLTDANLTRRVTAEILNVMGLNWLYQTERVNRIAAAISGQSAVMLHRFGRMGQEEGFYVDVGLQYTSNLSKDGTESSVSYLGTCSYFISALEHGIIDQYEFESNAAVSTVQILYLANESDDSNKNRIYLATANNWSAVSAQLVGYETDELQALAGKLTGDNILILPRNRNNGDETWDWDGSGYVSIESNNGRINYGMIITGDFTTSGGWSVNNSWVNYTPIYTTTVYSPSYSNYGGTSSIALSNTSSWYRPSYYSWDPVDMSTGAFVFDRTDISLGQDGPRGLSFSRHYNSNLRSVNDSHVGFGWTNSLAIAATERTAAEAGLGETTPAEAAAILTACAVINDLVSDPYELKEMVTAALLSKEAVDNLLNNAVSISMGKETVQFIKQPDGTYTAPAGNTMTLTATDTEYELQERLGSTFRFDRDNDGRITEIEDPFGNSQSFSYNTNDQLQTVTDVDERTLTLSYQDDLISSVTDSTGRSVSFQYDADKRLTHVTDPEGDTAQFIYDSDNCLTELIDPSGQTIIVNEYDSENRVSVQKSEGDTNKSWTLAFNGQRNTEVDPLGNEKVYKYDLRSRAVATIDAEGNQTSMMYDGQDRLTRQVTPGNLDTRTIYDPDGNLVFQVAAPNGLIYAIAHNNYESFAFVFYSGVTVEGVATTYKYDSLHRLIEQKIEDISSTDADRITTYHYNSGNTTNLPDSATDAEGNQTLFTYYEDGQLWTQTEVSTTGNRVTTYTYDSRGMPATVSYPDGTSESFVYNERGDMTSHTDRRNHTTTYQYNNRRQLTHTISPDTGTTINAYDDNGRLLSVTDPEENVTRYTYSAQGKLLTETTAYGTPEAATTTHEYDECDRLVRTIDPLLRVTEYAYDGAGRLTSVTDPLERETIFTYDGDGNRTSIITPEEIQTQYGYNERGERTSLTDPAENTVAYAYNSYGEQTGLTNRRNQTFGFTFDDNGNPLTVSTPLGNTTTMVYNDLNQVESVEEASGQTTTFVYDEVGRVEAQTDAVGTISFVYDDNGNPETVTEGTAVLTRTFDNMDRVETYTDAAGNEIEYGYDLNGNLTTLTYPDNKTVTYTYDAHNRLKTVTDWANRVTTYHWDEGGRMTGIDRPNNTSRVNEYTDGNELDRFFEYDSSQTALLAYGRFGYDNDSRMEWRYRLPQPQQVPNATLPAFDATYDIDNRIETWDGVAVTHDDDGNMTVGPLPRQSDFVAYTFDARNRLIGVDGTTYTYDAEDNRIATTTTEGTTSFVIDPHGDALPRVLVREKPDGSLTYYVYGIGLLYEVNEDEQENEVVSYYLFDQSGSTVALTDDSGTVTDRVEYSPYGTVTYREGTTDTPFLYAGQLGIQSEGNGLLYLRARYYSSYLHRFINADPTGFDGGLNWYSYANNSPMMYVDPDGEIAFIAIIAIGAIVGGTLDAAITTMYDVATTGSINWENTASAFLRGAIVGAVSTIATPAAGTLVGAAASPLLRSSVSIGIASLGSVGGQLAHNSVNSNYSWSYGLGQAAIFGALGQGIANRAITVPRWGYSLKQMYHFGPKKFATALTSRNSWYAHSSTVLSGSIGASSIFAPTWNNSSASNSTSSYNYNPYGLGYNSSSSGIK